MDSSSFKNIQDARYEKRKQAALDLEKVVRESSQDTNKLSAIVNQLCELWDTAKNIHQKYGALMGFAGVGIAMTPQTSPLYLSRMIQCILQGFVEQEGKMRYYACESLYNIAKIVKGETLVYFNEIFDALSRLSTDQDSLTKQGAELLDRLMKDIVIDQASTYVSTIAQSEGEDYVAFSLSRFVPLLQERMYVQNPFVRQHLVGWVEILGSVPELELVSHLPDFLDGLLQFLADSHSDVRIATTKVLDDLLDECRQIALVAQAQKSVSRSRSGSALSYSASAQHSDSMHADQTVQDLHMTATQDTPEQDHDDDGDDDGSWVPGQGVVVDYAAIMEILLQHCMYPADDIHATCLKWFSNFLSFVPEVMVAFCPRLITAILPSLAHPSPDIRASAQSTNSGLFRVIQSLPSPRTSTPPPVPPKVQAERVKDANIPKHDSSSQISGAKSSSGSPTSTTIPFPSTIPAGKRNMSIDATLSGLGITAPDSAPSSAAEPFPSTEIGSLPELAPENQDYFDYQLTVNNLTLQFLSDYDDTRVAALRWLIMLQSKAPNKILSMNDGTFPALLKTLSDSSEEVIKADLQLLSQISLSSEEEYFPSFMSNLLSLFSTDRRLLETRGSLIIRQLCGSLNTERIYRTFAELLEKEHEDLEFASLMVQNLHMIMITSPELSDFRRRLKNLDTKDAQMLFATLYRSWSHNAVSTFSLCLLAQAYEHAYHLLTIFAELEVTVSMLIQIDKLVQMLESPVFTGLRLQLLEPDKHPYLFKCLYGILMLLPQSSAFATLRNRLNSVSSLGYMHVAPRQSVATPTARTGRRPDDSAPTMKWQDLLSNFRSVQIRHERARRSAGSMSSLHEADLSRFSNLGSAGSITGVERNANHSVAFRGNSQPQPKSRNVSVGNQPKEQQAPVKKRGLLSIHREQEKGYRRPP